METCFKILQLKFDKKLTNRCIGLTLHISASTVFEVLARFKASSLSWPLPADISHDTLEKLIFPPKDTFASELVMPDMLYLDTEMRKPGVTRQLLWMEYKAQAGNKAMGYSHFCRCYREWKKTRRLSMRQEHRAGEKLFIDFCGPTVPVINPDTGEIRRVAIFVAVMGASNYTYVEACEGQDMMSWLNAHSRCPEMDEQWGYVGAKSRQFARMLGLEPKNTAVRSPESNGIAESFVKTIKRDYISIMPKPDGLMAAKNLAEAFEHYNEWHPHSALGYRSPREYLRQRASNGLSDNRCLEI